MAGYGRLITNAREAAGLNKVQLADRLSVDPSVVSKLEDEKMGVTPPMFMKLTTELRSLVPANLLNAMGYQVTVAGADRLPRGLVQDLLTFSDEELDALALVVQRRAHPSQPPQEKGR